jgi:hypothetical protein
MLGLAPSAGLRPPHKLPCLFKGSLTQDTSSPFTNAVTSNSVLAVGTVYYTSRLVTTPLSAPTLKIHRLTDP